MRIDCDAVLPEATRALRELDHVAGGSGLEPRLLELVRLRASQLNNCAYCLDMHSKDARALGEDEQRLHLLAAWRDAQVYTARERTALEWCEALTLLPERGASHEAYFPLKAEFNQREIVALTLGNHRYQRVESLRPRFRVARGQLCFRPTAPRAFEHGGERPGRRPCAARRAVGCVIRRRILLGIPDRRPHR